MKAKVLNQARWMVALTALVLAVEIALIVAGDAKMLHLVQRLLNVIILLAVFLLNPIRSLRIAYGTRAAGIWIVALTFIWAPRVLFSAMKMSDPWPFLVSVPARGVRGVAIPSRGFDEKTTRNENGR